MITVYCNREYFGTHGQVLIDYNKFIIYYTFSFGLVCNLHVPQ